MKFGKQLLSQQRPAWARYYLDYKALKKIIAGKLPSGASPGTPVAPPASPTSPPDTRAAFFDALGREVDKINAFYLEQQRALQDRVRSLVAIRATLASASAPPGSVPPEHPPPSDQWDTSDVPDPLPLALSPASPTVRALREAWAAVLVALARLEQFVELNAIGLRKILKKWDKRSKSQVRELYLARQLDVQPCFDRTLIAFLAATASSQLASLVPPSPPVVGSGPVEPEGPLARKEADLASALRSRNFAAAAVFFSDSSTPCVQAALWRVLWDELASDGPASEAVSAASDAADQAAQVLADIAFSRTDDINARRGLHMAAGAGIEGLPSKDRSADLLRAGLAYVARAAGPDKQAQDAAMALATHTKDAYTRVPLGYVAVRGCAPAVAVLLPHMILTTSENEDDGLSAALQLAVQENNEGVVRQLLEPEPHRAPIPDVDLAQPLTLAAERGRADTLRLLLQAYRNGEVVSASLGAAALAAARAGSTECLVILLDADASSEVRDALRGGWTPLFFAAEQGDVKAAECLLEHGADPLAVDEKDRTPAFYAAWEGQIEVAQLLLQAEHKAGSSHSSTLTQKPQENKKTEPEPVPALSLDDDMPDLSLGAPAQGEADTIPSLSLPPPILPFRTYGASYLGDLGDGSPEQALVSLTLTTSSIELDPVRVPLPPSPSLSPWPRPAPSSATAATSSAVVAALPLPLKLTLSASTPSLSVPWNITLPLTRAERIALRVPTQQKGPDGELHLEFALSAAFGRTVFARATLDPFTGESSQSRTVTVPLNGVPAGHGPIGKLTVEVQVVTPFPFDHKETPEDNKLSASPAEQATASPIPSASSMPGRYLRVGVRVQPTASGGGKVLVAPWAGASTTPLARSELAARAPEGSSAGANDDLVAWSAALEGATVALDDLLATLPPPVGVAIHVLPLPLGTSEPGPAEEVNDAVDAILRSVYVPSAIPAGNKLRNLIFSSDDPAVCTALNWKQPNYAVLFVAPFGVDAAAHVLAPTPATEVVGDSRCTSISEAVRFARDDNLLGLVLPRTLAEAAPALVPAIQATGLLAVVGADETVTPPGTVPDGFASSSVLVCKPNPQQV